MNKSLWVGAVLVTIAVLGGVLYLRYKQHEEVVQESAPATIETPQTLSESRPVVPPTDAIATPDTANAAVSGDDKLVEGDLETLFGAGLHDWLFPDRIIKRIVATIDSLDRDPVPMRLRPIRYVDGLMMVDATPDGGVILSPGNAKRYEPIVNLFSHVDAKAVADFYFRYQAQFQKAHEELGYRGQSFNDALLKAIDHIIATPDVAPPVKLVRPHVLYEFEDAHLERLSSGQKIMVRMGNKNASVVKAKLQEIRAALVAAR